MTRRCFGRCEDHYFDADHLDDHLDHHLDDHHLDDHHLVWELLNDILLCMRLAVTSESSSLLQFVQLHCIAFWWYFAPNSIAFCFVLLCMRGAVTSWELVIADARGAATRQEEKLQQATEGMVVEKKGRWGWGVVEWGSGWSHLKVEICVNGDFWYCFVSSKWGWSYLW